MLLNVEIGMLHTYEVTGSNPVRPTKTLVFTGVFAFLLIHFKQNLSPSTHIGYFFSPIPIPDSSGAPRTKPKSAIPTRPTDIPLRHQIKKHTK
jgi:hypothetical protein